MLLLLLLLLLKMISAGLCDTRRCRLHGAIALSAQYVLLSLCALSIRETQAHTSAPFLLVVIVVVVDIFVAILVFAVRVPLKVTSIAVLVVVGLLLLLLLLQQLVSGGGGGVLRRGIERIL